MTLKELKTLAKEISVLYVEDEKKIKLETEEFLRKLFDEVDVCENGQEGLDAFKKKSYDILITDINMPVMNGLEMIKEIRKCQPEQNVIVTSAHNEPQYMIPLVNEGVDRFILKPFNRKLFLAVLGKVCSSIDAQREKSKLLKQINEKSAEISMILDLVDTAIFSINGDKVENANIQTLNLTNNTEVKSFQVMLDNLGDYLVDEEGYFYANTIRELIQKSLEATDVSKKLKFHLAKKIRVFSYNLHQISNSDKYVFSFSDITELDKQTHINPFTSLANSIALKEEIQKRCTNDEQFYTLLLSIKNLENIRHWHGHESAIKAEVKTARMLDQALKNLPFEIYLSNYSKNSFILLTKLEDGYELEKYLEKSEAIFSLKEHSQSLSQKQIRLEFKSIGFEIKMKDPSVIISLFEDTIQKMSY